MSKHYKKLLFVLFSLSLGFFLALALGSAEEPPELTQEESNKALVKEAIIALSEDPNNYIFFSEHFDPNYVSQGSVLLEGYYEGQYWGEWLWVKYGVGPVRFKSIIAEDDMVAVHLEFFTYAQEPGSSAHSQLARFRIADGKIVEGWIAPVRYYHLSLTFTEEAFEWYRLEKNKALVKEAIWAWVEDPYDPNDFTLPEQFDPNYVQHDFIFRYPKTIESPRFAEFYDSPWSFTFESLIADGDMVAFRLYCAPIYYPYNPYLYRAIGMYRIANGKIVEGWIAEKRLEMEVGP